MLTWNDLPGAVKDRVVTIYETSGLETALRAVEKLNVETTGINLQRRIQEHRKLTKNIFGEDNTKAVLDALNVLKPSYRSPFPQPIPSKFPPR